MKKKVKIYKAPNGEGKFINKTSQFLAKAQMGGTPDPSMLAYPGAQQAPASQQDQTSQLMQFVANDITNQVAKEETLFKLVNIMGVSIDAATELYMVIAEQITQDVEEQDDDAYEEETGQKREKEDPLSTDEVITQNVEEDIDYDLYDDTGSDIIMQDSEEEDVLDEALDPLSEARFGGMPRRRYDDGGEYDVALPDAESYTSLVEPMTGYDLVSQMAWNNEEESESPYAEKEYANTTVDYSRLQKGGTYKKAKKKYVTSVMNLLKKQMGGESDDVNPNQGDPTGSNFRNGRLQAFTNTVKQNAQMGAIQNQLEQQYDQMMQEGGMMLQQQQDVENPMHHLQLYSQAASGIFGEPMNQTIKAQDGLSVGANLPRGFYKRSMRRFGNIPNIREVDVRKSGLFGPKQYTMYFDPLPLQQLSNPMTAEMYGYGVSTTPSKKQTRTFDAVKTYTNLAADAVNKESLKEVDKNTPDSEATTVKEEVSESTTPPIIQNPVVTNPVVTAPVIPPVVPPVVPPPPSSGYQLPSGLKPNQVDFAPGVTKVQNDIENFSPVSRGYAGVGLMGSSDYYKYDAPLGKWQYIPGDGKSTVFKDVKDQSLIDRLDKGDAKTLNAFTIKDKPGYYYRKRMDGSFAKYKGDPKKHNSSTRPITYITKKDKSYNYLDNKYWFENEGTTILNYKEQGGFVTDPFNNPMEPLQRFVGGGYDPSINDLSEDQIQYMDSKDVTDAYMQGGGFIKNFVPANLTRSSQNDVIQRVYNPLTGQTRQGGPGAGNYISAIDVRKRGITGTPKKYTIYYGAAGDPRYENLITLDGTKDTKSKDSKVTEKSERQQALENAGYGQRTDVTGLEAKSKRAIKQGERKRDRELEKLYEEDPTSVEFTAIDQNTPFDYETIMPGPLPIRSAQDELNTLIKQGPEHIATKEEIDALKSQLNMDYVPSRAKYDDPRGAEASKIYPDWFDPSGKVTDQTATTWDSFDTSEDPDINGVVDQSGNLIDPRYAPYYGIDEDPNMLPDPRMTSDFGPMSMEGPLATEEDQVPTLEEQYMEGFQPSITQDMIDEASGLRLPQQPIDMSAFYGMDYPADIIQPGVNPFELPVSGGQDYYPPFAQPTATIPDRNNQSVNTSTSSGPTLDQLRAQNRNNPNAGKKYTYNVNTSGMKEDPDYKIAMQKASKDGRISNEEAENAAKMFKEKQAQQEKDKIATLAQRTINQIMNSSASPAEKNAAREKVVLQMQQRWDEIDRVVNSRKYGGALSKFVGGGNQSFTGENPVVYTNNPMMQGKSDLDLISLNSGIQGAQGQVNWGSMSSPGTVNQRNNDGSMTYGVDATYKGPQAPEIKIDPMQQEEYQVAKTYSEPLAVDVKNKLSQGEREARLIAGNSLMRGVAGFKNRLDDSKQMEGFYDNLTADNLYASDPSRDRGDYAESGLYRPDEQGQTWYGRSAQMGGYIDDDFEDGEEVYMTDEEIKEYMANGGQIEFI